MIDGLDNLKCPSCGYIPEKLMDLTDIHEGQIEGSVCPACKRFIATDDWIILSEDEVLDAMGFGGMDELDFESDDEAEDMRRFNEYSIDEDDDNG